MVHQIILYVLQHFAMHAHWNSSRLVRKSNGPYGSSTVPHFILSSQGNKIFNANLCPKPLALQVERRFGSLYLLVSIVVRVLSSGNWCYCHIILRFGSNNSLDTTTIMEINPSCLFWKGDFIRYSYRNHLLPVQKPSCIEVEPYQSQIRFPHDSLLQTLYHLYCLLYVQSHHKILSSW